ncbi:MAG TPA: LPS export ABC transporter periplasmic protein LptC [Gammaproteobacteria bacterium]|nr:LPS export ABC transporter periplasmic protein LptC [Gammaproteobacteria bacterium]
MNLKQFGLLVLLLLSVIGTGWFLDKQDASQQPASVSTTGPDSFVRDIDLAVMDENGHLKYQVRAEHMAHFPNDDMLKLSRPDIDIVRTDGAVWHIKAERGKTSTSGDRLWLLGEVDIHHSATTTGSDIHVSTSDLLVKPEDELAETENAATITGDRYVINAVGLKADFRTHTLELLSRVRGTIEGSSDGTG